MLKEIKIKLKTMWMLDSNLECNVPEKYLISHGIWMTNGLEFRDSLLIYDMVCISSNHKDIKIGDTRRLLDMNLISMCHEVKLVSMPKLEL